MMEKKHGFRMPHFLWIMIGMILVCSILTYLIPAGEFAVDEGGRIIGADFHYVGVQSPVSPLDALLDIFPGLMGASAIIFTVLICGAALQVFLDTKSFDILMDWSIYKMQGSGETLLITILFFLMAYLGAFGGSDALIAVIPIGIIFAKKLRLDAITALGVSLFATMVGFGTGACQVFIMQSMVGTRPFGAFFSRFVIMNIIVVASLIMVLSYVRKIKKDPTRSLMYSEGWRPEPATKVTELKPVKMSARVVINLVLFIGQYGVIVYYGIWGDPDKYWSVMNSTLMFVAFIMGIIAGMSADDVANSFAKGLANMAFVVFIIGLAKTVSIVLSDGKVLHTIVYFITRPLLELPRWLSSVGMTIVIAIINPIIPSATSKAAILIPIMKPIGEVLGLEPEIIVQTFQFGDGFTNLISPLLGWTVGGVALAGVPFDKWVRWIFPKVLMLLGLSCVMIFVMTACGWSGTI